jgi:hypothetical protein
MKESERDSSVFPPPCAHYDPVECVCHPTRRAVPRHTVSANDADAVQLTGHAP